MRQADAFPGDVLTSPYGGKWIVRKYFFDGLHISQADKDGNRILFNQRVFISGAQLRKWRAKK